MSKPTALPRQALFTAAESAAFRTRSSAVAAGVLSVGFAGTVQAAPKPDGWGGSARVKASKSVAPVDVNGLRRTPRM